MKIKRNLTLLTLLLAGCSIVHAGVVQKHSTDFHPVIKPYIPDTIKHAKKVAVKKDKFHAAIKSKKIQTANNAPAGRVKFQPEIKPYVPDTAKVRLAAKLQKTKIKIAVQKTHAKPNAIDALKSTKVIVAANEHASNLSEVHEKINVSRQEYSTDAARLIMASAAGTENAATLHQAPAEAAANAAPIVNASIGGRITAGLDVEQWSADLD